MADEYKIPISFDLKTDNATSEGAKAGQQAAQGFQASFKPKIDIGKSIDADALAKTIASSIQSAIKSLNIGDEIAKAFANIDLSKAGAGQTVGGGGAKGGSGGTPSQPPTPPSPSIPSPKDFEAEVNSRIKPVLSGLEAMGMLLRGASIGTALQTAVRDFNLAKAAAATTATVAAAAVSGSGGGGLPPAVIPPGGGGGPPVPPVGGGLSILGVAGTVAKFATYASGVGLIVAGAKELSDVVSDMAIEGASADSRVRTMAKTLGTSLPDFLRMDTELKKSGTSMEEFYRSFSRMTVTARREMPDIEDRFKRAGDTTEEYAIKAREADRNVAKARDDRVLATDKAIASEVELAKFEAIGALLREQQIRSGELGVSGAQIGLRGAQIQQAAANVNLQMAGRDAALAEVQGPLTVAGARLGVKGAQISESEAKARLRELTTGEKEDEWTVKQREIKKARHAVEVAKLNTEQAKVREEQVQNDEIRRQSMTAAGAGPVALAQQQAIQAAQAVEQSKLGVDRTNTDKIALEHAQRGNPLQAERNKLTADKNAADRAVPAAADAEQRAKAAASVTRDELANAKYQDPRYVLKAVQDTIAGRPPEDFDLNKALGQGQRTLQDALTLQGGGKGLDISRATRQFMQQQEAAGAPQADLLSVMQMMFPGRATQGAAGDRLLNSMLKKEPLTAYEERSIAARARQIDADAGIDKEISREKNLRAIREEEQRRATLQLAKPLGVESSKFGEFFQIGEPSKQMALRLLGGLDAGTNLIESFGESGAAFNNRVLRGINPWGDRFVPSPMGAWDQYRPGQPLPGQPLPGQTPPPIAGQPPLWPPQPVPVQPPQTQVLPDLGSKIDAVGTAIAGKTSTIPSAIDGVASAISAKAAEIASINIPKGTVTGTASGSAGVAIEQAAGGPIYGAGTSTSDSIDAKLSHGEYVVQASAVSKVGVPFLNSLNAGKLHFAAGGISEIDERKRRGIIDLGGGDLRQTEERRSGTIQLAGGGIAEINERRRRGIIDLGGGAGISEIDERKMRGILNLGGSGGGLSQQEERGGTISLANGGSVDEAVVKALLEAGIDPKTAFDEKGNLKPGIVQQLAMAKAIANMKGLSPAVLAALMAASKGFTPGYNPKGSGITDAVRFAPGFGPPKTPEGVPPGSEISPGGGFYRDPRESIKIWRTVPGGPQPQPSGGRAPTPQTITAPPSTGSKTITAPSAEPPREPPPPTKEQMPLDITLPSDYVPKQRYEELLERPAYKEGDKFKGGDGKDYQIKNGEICDADGNPLGKGGGGKDVGGVPGGVPGGIPGGTGLGDSVKVLKPGEPMAGSPVDKTERPGRAPENDGNKYVTIIRNNKASHYLVGKADGVKGGGKEGMPTGTGKSEDYDLSKMPKTGIPPLPVAKPTDIIGPPLPLGMQGIMVPPPEKEEPLASAKPFTLPGPPLNLPKFPAPAGIYDPTQRGSGEGASVGIAVLPDSAGKVQDARSMRMPTTGTSVRDAQLAPPGTQTGSYQYGPFRVGNPPINVPPPAAAPVEAPVGPPGFEDRFGGDADMFRPSRRGSTPGPQSDSSKLQLGRPMQAGLPFGIVGLSTFGKAALGSLMGHMGLGAYATGILSDSKYLPGAPMGTAGMLFEKWQQRNEDSAAAERDRQAAEDRADKYGQGVDQLRRGFYDLETPPSDELAPKYQPEPSDSTASYIPPPPPEPPPEEEKDKVYARTGGYVRDLIRGFAGGGFAEAVSSFRGYANGGPVMQQLSGSAPNLSAHQLDLRTDAGTFSTKADGDTMQGIINSSLRRRLVQISQPATWNS